MRLSHTGLRVLKAFMDRPGVSAHGYDLMQTTGVASGTLYPLLMRFEEAGWMISSWENVDPVQEGRPRRRLYRVTGAGQAAIAQYMSALGLGTAA